MLQRVGRGCAAIGRVEGLVVWEGWLRERDWAQSACVKKHGQNSFGAPFPNADEMSKVFTTLHAF